MPADITGLLEQWRTNVEAATEGPWSWEATGDKDNSWALGFVQDEDGNTLSGQLDNGEGIIIEGVCESVEDANYADAEFIVTARTAMPALLAAIGAVLELHQPSVRRQGWPPTCHYDNRSWPCPEVQAIRSALAGTGDSDEGEGS
jgi:hypothetical protein